MFDLMRNIAIFREAASGAMGGRRVSATGLRLLTARDTACLTRIPGAFALAKSRLCELGWSRR
jgi:hypothetical protein